MSSLPIVEDLGRYLGCELVLSRGEAICATLSDGSLLHIEHEERERTLHLYLLLGQEPCDEKIARAVYRRMLCANAFNHETAGATLGIDDGSGDLVLSRRFSLDESATNGRTLHDAVCALSSVAMQWSSLLSRAAEAVHDELLDNTPMLPLRSVTTMLA